MLRDDTLALAIRLVCERRGEVIRELARHLGAESLVIFVRDGEVGALLPAPGFPQTLPGGRAWRELVARSAARPRSGVLPAGPDATPTPTAGFPAADGSVLVLIGGAPDAGAVEELLGVLPLLAAVFRAEQRALSSEARAAVAQSAMRQAETLAANLARAQADLESAHHQLRDADRRKDQFLAMLAHELRNPLAPLLTSLHLIKVHRDAAAVERAIAIAHRQTHQLTRLVDDLLDVSRITRGKIELKKERLSLTSVVSRAVESTLPHMQSRGHRLHVSLPEEPLWLMGDPVRLQQVVVNLLSNSAKYTEPGGEIWIEAERDGAEVLLKVRDTGIGIDSELLPHVFDMFVQADRSLARSQGGLGLGLTLVRTLVEMHAGSVSAHSEGVGHGSEFRVRLPLLQPQAAPWTPDPAHALLRGCARHRRILVVDDNLDAAEVLAEALRSWGNEVRVAHDGLAAVTEAEIFEPELVFLDIGLPGIDGYEVAVRLRQRQRLARTRLVALTGYGQESDRRRALETGFDVYMVKPIDAEALRQVLDDGAGLPEPAAEEHTGR